VLRDEETVVVDIKPPMPGSGPECVPENLQPGEVVPAMKVSNMVVSLRRSSESHEAGRPS
jgi:hypothetical protein